MLYVRIRTIRDGTILYQPKRTTAAWYDLLNYVLKNFSIGVALALHLNLNELLTHRWIM